jgi:cation transport ATPase
MTVSAGTLTHGKPTVTDTKLLTDKISRKRFFELVGLAESASEHVLGTSLYRWHAPSHAHAHHRTRHNAGS